MNANAPHVAPEKGNPTNILRYGYDRTKGIFFHEENGKTTLCSAQELLKKTERFLIPDIDRGSLLLGFPI